MAIREPNPKGKSRSEILAEVQRLDAEVDQELAAAIRDHQRAIMDADQELSARNQQIDREKNDRVQQLTSSHQTGTQRLEGRINGWLPTLGRAQMPWADAAWAKYEASLNMAVPKVLRIGSFSHQGAYTRLMTPALLPLIGSGKNWLIRAKGEGKPVARKFLQSAILRMLSSVPAGKAQLIGIDPVGLGSTMAGFIQDLEQPITQGLAWSETNQIDAALIALEQQMATIRQKYLGVRFESIEGYNLSAGMVDEPYRLLAVADFPARFSPSALDRLTSIATNGPSLGVYCFIMVDDDQKPPYNFNIQDLQQVSYEITIEGKQARLNLPVLDKCVLELDQPPQKDRFIHILQQISTVARERDRVELPFGKVISDQNMWWKKNAVEGISFPIGQIGARDQQFFTLKGDHSSSTALVIGRVGTGKSNLLQVIIDSVLINYPPEEVELYLLDMKQVTFEVYARNKVPHAHAIGIQAEIDFAMSILKKVDRELDHRKDLLRDASCTEYHEYRQRTNRLLPRVVLIIDEFQDLFLENRSGEEAQRIIQHLVREGRAFGVHLILASQTLRGQQNLPSAVKSLIPTRIALQSTEADSLEILGENNTEATLLTRAGEAIYNNQNGRIEGNSRFQTYYLDQGERDKLISSFMTFARARNKAVFGEQVIFDGRARIDIRENQRLARLISAYPPAKAAHQASAWVGAPLAIEEHPAIRFQRTAGRNVLLVGGDGGGTEPLAALGSMMISLAAQYPPAQAQFHVISLGGEPSSSGYFSQLLSSIPGAPKLTVTQAEAKTLVASLAQELEHRKTSDQPMPVDHYLIIHEAQKFRDLRVEDRYSLSPESPGAMVLSLLKEGPEYGLYCLIHYDTYTTFNRGLNRSLALEHIDSRVLFRCSPNDSEALISSAAASTLGPNRAILFSTPISSTPIKIRPYALPDLNLIKNFNRKQM